MNSFIKAYSVDKKSIYLLKLTLQGRELKVQRFLKPRSKLDFVKITDP